MQCYRQEQEAKGVLFFYVHNKVLMTYLIISCNEFRHCMKNALSRELTGTCHFLEVIAAEPAFSCYGLSSPLLFLAPLRPKSVEESPNGLLVCLFPHTSLCRLQNAGEYENGSKNSLRREKPFVFHFL